MNRTQQAQLGLIADSLTKAIDLLLSGEVPPWCNRQQRKD
jgi:hypothetical protein